MANRSDIEAGKSHVSFYIKGREAIHRFIAELKGQLQTAGSLFMKIGPAMMGVGVGLTTALAGTVAKFAQMGTELDRVSQRTGMASSSLAEMKYAAESVGGGLADVESALNAMRSKYLDPSQFDEYAAAVASIENPALRAARAQEIFGSAGQKLLPMLGQMGRLRQEARDLGLVPTDQAVQDAAEIGQAFSSIKSAVAATFFEIGAAIGPMLKPGLDMLKNIVGTANRWIRENAGIVRTVAMIGAGLIAAGAAVTVIGGVMFAIGSATAIWSAAVGTVGSALAFVVSPLGIVLGLVAGIGAGIYAWVRYTDSGKAAFASFISFAQPLIETLKTTVGGVFDALKGGDVLMAGRIALKGLQILFFDAFASIAEGIGGQMGDTLGTIGQKLMGGDFAGAFKTALKQIWAGFVSFSEGIVALFTQGARAATKVWQDAVNKISDFLLDASAAGGATGRVASAILGVDMNKETERARVLEEQRRAVARRSIERAIADQQGRLETAEAYGDTATAEDARRAIANFQRDLAQLGGPIVDPLEDAKNAAREQTQGIADRITAMLDNIDQATQDATAAANANLADDTAGGSSRLREQVEQLKAELAAMRAEAAELAKAAADRNAAGKNREVAGGIELAARTASTTSAAGALLLGQGAQSPIERAIERADAREAKRHAELVAVVKGNKLAMV